MQCLWAQWLRKELRFKSETRVIQQFNRASRLCVLCEWCHIQAFCGKMQIIWCKCMKIWHAYNIKQEDSVGTNKNRHHMENRRLLMHNASPGCRLAEWATPHPRILWLKFLKKTQQQQKQTKKKKHLIQQPTWHSNRKPRVHAFVVLVRTPRAKRIIRNDFQIFSKFTATFL